MAFAFWVGYSGHVMLSHSGEYRHPYLARNTTDPWNPQVYGSQEDTLEEKPCAQDA
jgi:hypothetical protein